MQDVANLGVPADQPTRTEQGRARVRGIRVPHIEVTHASVIADAPTCWQTAAGAAPAWRHIRLQGPEIDIAPPAPYECTGRIEAPGGKPSETDSAIAGIAIEWLARGASARSHRKKE